MNALNASYNPIIQTYIVYISIYKYSQEHNNITIGSNI